VFVAQGGGGEERCGQTRGKQHADGHQIKYIIALKADRFSYNHSCCLSPNVL
jgi:hypothetical protein